MKRFFYSCIFILCSMASVYAYSFKVDGIYYNILSGTTEVEVTNETGGTNANSYTGSVVIPSTVSYNSKSYTVTTIGESSFHGCTGLTSVIFPESIVLIRFCAFRGCTGLTEVTLPESVSELKSLAFSNCDALQEVHVQSSEPPVLSPHTFMNVSSNKIKVYIPKGSEAKYLATEVWKDMDLVMNEYDIIVEVDNPEYGTVSGNGKYKYNSEAMIEALPSAGYSFDKWDDGNTENPRTIKVVGDATYTANFVGADYTVSVTSTDEMMGTVTIEGEAPYTYGEKVTIKATANNGYEFIEWSDGDTNATREITVTSDTTITATFTAIEYTVALSVNDAAMGTVAVEGEAPYTYGETITIKATANTGYEFVKWSDESTEATHEITVTSDTTITATFKAIECTVALSVNDAAMGTVTIEGEAPYTYGETITLKATANTGYKFVKWSDESTEAIHEITITSDTTITATFKAI